LRSAQRWLSARELEAAEPGALVERARAELAQARVVRALAVRAPEPVLQVAELRAEQAPPVAVDLLEQPALVPAVALPT